MASVLSSAPVVGVLRAQNLQRAGAYYRDILGLAVEDGGNGQLNVTAGDGTHFSIYENPGLPAPGNTTLAFAVPDLLAAIHELRSNGVEFKDLDIPEMEIKTEEGVSSMTGGQAAWFMDSEGNWIVLTDLEGR